MINNNYRNCWIYYYMSESGNFQLNIPFKERKLITMDFDKNGKIVYFIKCKFNNEKCELHCLYSYACYTAGKLKYYINDKQFDKISFFIEKAKML